MRTMNHCVRSASCGLVAVLALTGVTVAMAGGTPPEISALDGSSFAVKISGKGYERTTGAAEAVKGTMVWTLTRTGTETLTILQHGDDGDLTLTARYDKGLLVIGQVDDEELATNAVCGYFVVSGTAGKLKLSGEFISFDSAPDGEASLGKIAGKQTSKG